ncbi:MAG: TetR/AcrR family transcriptional regulator [Clostridia bacterium]|jgi:TetR/AcrR family fatty acid metabolism transcriptional regulator|nr:TetR/AcrR family transcriptional regulator [Clostridia bacterium]
MFEPGVTGKRKLILKAATEVFSDKGFYGAKIEDIAQAAAIGKGTVYEYFRSKEQLFTELIKEGVQGFENMLAAEIQKAQTAREKLRCLIRVQIKFGQRYRLLAKSIMNDYIPLDDAFRSWLRQLHTHHLDMIEEIIRGGMAAREIRPIDPGIFALLFYGGMGMICSPLQEKEFTEEELEKTAGQILDYYFTGLAAAGGC